MKKALKFEYLLGIAMIGFMFPIHLKVGFTNMGIFNFYVSMPIFLLFAFIFLYKSVKFNFWKKKIVLTYLALCGWYCVAFFFRFITKQYFYQSLEIAFWSLAPISVFILLLHGYLNYNKVCSSMFYAISFIDIFSFIYHVFYLNQLRSELLGNINMLVFFNIFSIYLSCFYYYMNTPNKINTLFFIVNMFYSLFVIILSGSRAGVLIGLSSYIFLLIFLGRTKKFRKVLGIVIFLSLFIISYFALADICGSRYLIQRGFNYSTIGTSISESKNIGADVEGDENVEAIQNAIQEAMQAASKEGDIKSIQILNDMTRISMWKNAITEIRKSPIIGTGKVGIYRTPDGSQTAHNFFLEYWLVFGGIGIIIWITLIIQILFILWKKTVQNRPLFCYTLLFLASTMIFSCVEPTLSNTFGPFIVWCTLGILIAYADKVN